jgi:photosystem II stability/assembly factor-like uncharacterized protein
MTRLRALLAVAAALSLGMPALAAVNEWTGDGPPGAILIHATYVNGSGAALAISNRRLYRTTDNGGSWTQVLVSDFVTDPLVAVNPANSNQVLAALDTLYRSVDGGLTWNPVSGLPAAMYASPSHPTQIAWSRDGSTAWAATSSAVVYRSTDGGASWSARSTGVAVSSQDSISLLEVDASDPGVVYALTSQNLYRTTDGGANWAGIANIDGLTWIAPSRVTSGFLLARKADSSLETSSNFGASWSAQSGPNYMRFYPAPSSANMFYSMSYTGTMQVSTNAGVSWSALTDLPVTSSMEIAIDPANPSRLMMASQAGAYTSTDGGASWTARSAGMNELMALDAHVRTGDSPALFISTIGDQGVYQRSLGLGHWSGIAASAIPLVGRFGDTATGFAVAPSDGTLYLQRNGQFVRSADGGFTWELRGQTAIPIKLTVDPADPLAIYGTDQFIRHEKSIDGGVTWAEVGTGLPGGVASFLVQPSDHLRVYALASNYNYQNPSPLYRSSDGGQTWAATPWSFSSLYHGQAIALDPDQPGTLYVGLDIGLYKTTDDGATWTKLAPYTQSASVPIYSIAVDTASTSTVYVSTTSTYGPMRSGDGGATWQPLRASAAESQVYIDRVAVIPGGVADVIGLGGYGGVYELTVAPDLHLTSATSAITLGVNAKTTFTVTNDGEHTATHVKMQSALPAANDYTIDGANGLVCARTPTTPVNVVCNVGSLPPKGTASFSVTFAPSAAATWSIYLSAYEADPVVTNNQVDIAVQDAPPPPPPPPPPPTPSPPSTPSPSGGGGGRIDYLLLGVLGFLLIGRRRIGGHSGVGVGP